MAVGKRWQNQMEQAKREGFSTPWQMRKAKAAAKAKRNGFIEPVNSEPRQVLIDRLSHGTGPVRQLMANGEWLIPESDRPQPVLRHSPIGLPSYSLGTKLHHDYRNPHTQSK